MKMNERLSKQLSKALKHLLNTATNILRNCRSGH